MDELLAKLDEQIAEVENTLDGQSLNNLKQEVSTLTFPLIADRVKEMEKKLDEVETAVINQKKAQVARINSTLQKLNKTKNRNAMESLAKEISALNDPYFAEYLETWNKKLLALEEKIFKSECKKYKYRDLLRDPDIYYGIPVYFKGKVTQVDYSGFMVYMRVYVTSKNYRYIKLTTWDDDIYLSYANTDGNNEKYGRYTEGDIIQIYGVMVGNESYSTVLGGQRTIPAVQPHYLSRVK